ncbi:MAG: hypothetical protein EOP39_08080 [Rubrivivax sp.]|nr:MAG: hypothetical protein EOP39_08080 [Rubrivivax sp.]
MAQQINLLAPILLTPKRYFSAQALLQACGLLIVVGIAVALWMQQRDRRADAEHQALLASYAAERQQLTVARVSLPAPLDANALQQQLQPLEAGNEQRRALLRTVGSEGGGRAGQRHSDLLTLVARSLPEAAWLADLRYAPGRLELVGGTLQTPVLRPWFSQLAAHPLLAGQELSALRVERLGSPGSSDNHGNALLSNTGSLAGSGLPIWAFRVVSAPAQPASGAAR